jgi:hypothetical protein
MIAYISLQLEFFCFNCIKYRYKLHFLQIIIFSMKSVLIYKLTFGINLKSYAENFKLFEYFVFLDLYVKDGDVVIKGNR